MKRKLSFCITIKIRPENSLEYILATRARKEDSNYKIYKNVTKM